MKYIAIILMISLFSCKKSTDAPQKQCYRCTFSLSPAGIQRPPLDTCINPWDDIYKSKFLDINGNDLSFNCKRTN